MEVAQLYRNKEVSPVEVIQQVFDRLEKIEPSINAFISTLKEDAYQSAIMAEKKFLNNEETHLLCGIPYSLKDLFYTKNVRTTCGSNVLKGFVPSYSATVVEKIKETDAVLIGKNNMLEFAYGIVHPDFGQTNNPNNVNKTAGGSSGGSAAAVSAGLGYFSLGTDTGGSIRIPGSYCGVVGLKPTYGLVSTFGVFPLSWSLDHVGPIAKNVKEVAVILNVIAGHDSKDPYSMHGDYSLINLSQFNERIYKKRIGVLPDSYLKCLKKEVKNVYQSTLEMVVALGFEIKEIKIENWHLAEEMIMNILLPEAAQIHQYMMNKREQYAPLTYEQLELGMKQRAIDYLNGLHQQKEFKRTVNSVLDEVDVLLTPTVSFPVPDEDPVIGDAEMNEMTFTGPFNLSGHPALTFNMAALTNESLPVGMQLIGHHFREEELLQIAHLIEQQGMIKGKE